MEEEFVPTTAEQRIIDTCERAGQEWVTTVATLAATLDIAKADVFAMLGRLEAAGYISFSFDEEEPGISLVIWGEEAN